MAYVPLRTAMAQIGLSKDVIRKYGDLGLIPTIKLPNGHRRFDCDAYIGKAQPPKKVGYCRVSSKKQQDDLLRQIEYVKSIYPDIEIISDVGSGLNFKRKGLKTLLGRLMSGEKLTLVVTYRDRLVRFGFDLLKYLVEYNSGELVVLDRTIETAEQELTSDLLAILHHFSCRSHGLRSHKSQEDSGLPNKRTSECISSVARDLKACLQQDCGTPETS